MQNLDYLKQYYANLERIEKLDAKSLIRKEELGLELNFSSAEDDFERTINLFKGLINVDISRRNRRFNGNGSRKNASATRRVFSLYINLFISRSRLTVASYFPIALHIGAQVGGCGSNGVFIPQIPSLPVGTVPIPHILALINIGCRNSQRHNANNHNHRENDC